MPSYEALVAAGPPKLGTGWRGGLLKAADIAGQLLAPGVEQLIPGTVGNYEMRLGQAAQREKTGLGLDYERARTEEQGAKTEQERARAEQERARAAALRTPKADKTIPPETDDYYSLLDQINPDTGKNYTSQEALEQVKGAGKQDRQFTNAFEAFTYGSPEQKQSAKDFIDYEKRINARYRTPNEFDLRYKLYREDPDTYRAMFGDKGEAADERARAVDERARAQNRTAAISVLRYTQHQRDEISKNFMLGEDERAQKLRDLDEFERPFKEAVAGGSDGRSDRVNVIHPDGTPGTIPRSQLGAAKRKGYRVAQ